MTASTDREGFEGFRFAPDPAERAPEPGEWYRDPDGPPLFCDGPDGPTGPIAHVYRLCGDDPSRYVIPKLWRYDLRREVGRYLVEIPGTTGAADTAAEAMRAAETALAGNAGGAA